MYECVRAQPHLPLHQLTLLTDTTVDLADTVDSLVTLPANVDGQLDANGELPGNSRQANQRQWD